MLFSTSSWLLNTVLYCIALVLCIFSKAAPSCDDAHYCRLLWSCRGLFVTEEYYLAEQYIFPAVLKNGTMRQPWRSVWTARPSPLESAAVTPGNISLLAGDQCLALGAEGAVSRPIFQPSNSLATLKSSIVNRPIL